MSSENTNSSIAGADTTQTSVANTSTLIAHATIDADPTSSYPRRKLLIITNQGAVPVMIKIGSAPTDGSDYHFALMPATYGASVVTAPPGVYYSDCTVPQDNIYAITHASTCNVSVYVGV